MSVKISVLMGVATVANVCFSATTYDLANGDVSVPANATAIITQANISTQQARQITIGNNATVTLKGINMVQNGQGSLIKCSGNATVILADGTVNTLDKTTTRYDRFPFEIAGSSNTTVVIKGESAGTGKLIAKAPDYYRPGIGGGNGGNLRIEGGVIQSTGSNAASGIGYFSDYGSDKSLGNITIKGGTVKASGSMAGIGTIRGKITISGGTVNASGYNRAGIYSDADIIISGGVVNVTNTYPTIGTAGIETKGTLRVTEGITKVVAGSRDGAPIIANQMEISSVLVDVTSSNGRVRTLTCPTYTITWKNYDGTTLKTNTGVRYGTMPSYSGSTPTKPSTAQYSYTFKGWSPTVVAATANKTYTATFTETVRKYTVTWKNDDGTTLKTESVAYGTTPNYGATPTKASTAQYDYTFAGWSPSVVAVTGAVTYTATFTASTRKYTVTWKNDDGNSLRSDSLFYGAMPSYEGDTPTKDPTMRYAYSFDGWSPALATVTSNVTYTATYLAEPLKVVFSPVSGTTFENALSISISFPLDGVNIYYTTNGVDPTVESTAYQRFRIYGKTTVKAVAEKNGLLSEIATAEYALGQCVDPVFSLVDGSEFAHSNQVVSIRWNDDGVLRYTLDGTDPTAESPIYDGPFAFSDSVELRAKVFSDEFFDSAVVTSRLTRVWENVETPVIDAAASFTGSKTKVVISCATDGATVRYTLNGNEPNSHSTKYTGPIYVTDSCTVKAYATMLDYLDSAVATQAIEKVWGIGDSLGKPDHGFTTDGTGGAGWTRVTDATSPNGEAMKSGAITHNQTSVLETTVMGPGTLTFSWRTSCEEDPDGRYEWDHVEFSVDGVVLLRRDGETQWKQESVRIEGDGAHIVTWTYKKDDVEGAGEDSAWVAGYGWTSDYTETQTTEVHVPYTWLRGQDSEIIDEFDVYENAAKAKAANGYKTWECYAVNVSSTNKNDAIKITAFPMKADGTPDLDNLTFAPPKSEWNVQSAVPRLKGRAQLDAGEWQDVPAGGDPTMRFFKIEVKLP